MSALSIDPAFAERNLNEGFSGGEKKRHEILQLELLEPKIAILDETDSGLDVDALQGGLRGRQPVPRGAGRRGAADHPLHPDPAVREAGLRARVRRPAGSSRRAAPSWPSCWRTRATRSSRREVPRHDHLVPGTSTSRPRPGGLPDPGPDGPQRQAAGLPGLRRAPRRSRSRCSTPSARTTSSTTPTSHRGAHLLGEEATDAYEGGAGQGRGVPRRADRTRSSSPRTPPRRSTWSPTR